MIAAANLVIGVSCLGAAALLVGSIWAYFGIIAHRRRIHRLLDDHIVNAVTQPIFDEFAKKAAAITSKEIPMTEDMSRSMTATPGDYEASINDYQRDRLQDQELNNLVMQLMDLERLPWEVRSISYDQQKPAPDGVLSASDVLGKDNSGRHATGLLAVIRMITTISKPIAAAGNYKSVSGQGSSFYITAGNARITCSTAGEQRRILQGLNAETAQALLPLRQTFLQAVKDYVTTRQPVDASKYCWCAYASSQDCAVFTSRADALAATNTLNSIYQRLTDDVRSKILKDIEEWASSSMASLSAPTPKDETAAP